MSTLLGLKSAGAYMGISARSVRRLIDRKILSYHKIGGLLKISESDLQIFLKNSRVEAKNAVDN